MKQTFKFSFFAVLLLSLFTITSCEDNLETSCDDFSATISYDLVDSSFVTLTANPIGGVEPITYAWSTGETTQSIDITEEDVYSVTLTDASDCTASLDFTVQDTTVNTGCPTIFVNIVADSVMTGDFEITAEATGGSLPYTYNWNTNETTQSILTEGPGSYNVTVTDADGCTGLGSYVYVGDSTPCSNFFGQINIDYNPAGGATLTASVSGGTPGYIYEWSTGEITQSIVANAEGEYTVIVSDSEGCSLALTTVYEAVDCDSFAIEIVAMADSSSTNEILFVATNDGSSINEYLWSNGDISPNIVVEPTGTYSVTVVNSFGCIGEDEYEF